MTRITIYLALMLAALTGCGNKKTANTDHDDKVNSDSGNAQIDIKSLMRAGTLIPKINCPGDPALSFAMYVPKSFKANTVLPLLLLFDPHADGSLPLQQYKALADTYGYILVGSNDSKNGNTGDQSKHIVEEMVKVVSDLPSDSKRIYAAGFSGGGRIAAILALSGGVQGLAVCGAGFPANQWHGQPPSIIVGIAGNDDMNLNELVSFKPMLEGQAARFQLIRTTGGHAWPETNVFETAFMAFECYAMRDSLRQVDDVLLRHIDDQYRTLVNKLSVSGKIMETLSGYEAWIKSLSGLYNVSVTADTYEAMNRKPEYRMVREKDNKLFEEEAQLKQQYQSAIGTKDTLWWQNEMGKIKKEATNHSDPLRASMYARVRGYLSLYCYSAITHALSGGPSPTLNYLCTLYRCIDAENVEAWYLSAVQSAGMHDKNHAIGYLSEAQACGLNDRNRLMNEPAFAELVNDPAYANVLSKMTN